MTIIRMIDPRLSPPPGERSDASLLSRPTTQASEHPSISTLGRETLLSCGIRRLAELVRSPVDCPYGPSLERNRDLAFRITGIFEGGRYGSVQTIDDGVVSYGRHQATLRSGALESVLERYLSSASGPIAEDLREYLPAVRRKDAALRGDEYFLSLLRSAAAEAPMQRAQDDELTSSYWIPALLRAGQSGRESPLTLAVFFDTNVQGGLNTILSRTESLLDGTSVTEAEFLRVFLDQRRSFLHSVAERKRAAGLDTQAEMLGRSAEVRIGAFEALLESGNLMLDEPFAVAGTLLD